MAFKEGCLDKNGNALHIGDRVVVPKEEFPNLWNNPDTSPYGYITEFSEWIYITRDDGEVHQGYSTRSLLYVGQPCPRCEKNQVSKGDYLCHECRYGV